MIPRRTALAMALAAIPVGAGARATTWKLPVVRHRRGRTEKPLAHSDKRAGSSAETASPTSHLPASSNMQKMHITLSEPDELAGMSTVYAEARGEPAFGQMAIVHVMLNRVASPLPIFQADTSMVAACTRHSQFAKPEPIPTDALADMRSIVRQATLLWNEGRDFSNCAVLFKRFDCPTPKDWGATRHAQRIGSHEFRSVLG